MIDLGGKSVVLKNIIWCSGSKMIAGKCLVMLYYHRIMSSCFLSVSTSFEFGFGGD